MPLKLYVSYQHVAWVYAFRFLRVSLSFELSTHQDTLSAFTHLKRISAIAKYYGDKAVIAIASTIEAMAHLRQSNSNEDIEQAQRSLADARSCQLDPLVASLPQLAALMQFIDLCSTLRKFDPNQAVSKMQAMQSILEPFFEASSTENGVFAIPICRSPYSSSGSTGGVIQNLSDGGLGLMFNWLPGEDIYLLGFLLSGIALAHDNQRAEKMFREGLKTRESKY